MGRARVEINNNSGMNSLAQFATAAALANNGNQRSANDRAMAGLNEAKMVRETRANDFIANQMAGAGDGVAGDTLAQRYALHGLDAPKLTSVQGNVGVADYRPIEQQSFSPTPLGQSMINKNEAQALKAAEPSNGITIGPDGTVQIGGNRMAKSPQELNESQGKNYSFGNRMSKSGSIIDEIEGSIAGKNAAQSLGQVAQEFAVGTTVGNQFVGENFQLFDQAKRDFVNAILRRESGAVISDQEFANAEKQYFPVPGDSPKVVAQKRANRRLSTRNILETGGVYPEDDTEAQAAGPEVMFADNDATGETLMSIDGGKTWQSQ